MEIIGDEQALARAYEVAASHPVTPIDEITCTSFEGLMARYFPEFEGDWHVGGWITVVERARRPFRIVDGGAYVFDIAAAARSRVEIYEYEYVHCGMTATSEVFEFLSFGAAPPENRGELLQVARDFWYMWKDLYPEWCVYLAKLKTGRDPVPRVVDAALDTGIDLNVEAYLQGVPIEHLISPPPSYYIEVWPGLKVF